MFNEAAVLEPRLNRNFYTALPGMVTGFGLLCTFVAILIALLGVHLGENHQFTGLDKLISGLSGKFVSSIVALLAATLFVPCEKWLFHHLTTSLHGLVTALDALVPRLTPAHLLEEIRSYMEEQSTAFKHFNSDLSTKLKQGVEEGIETTEIVWSGPSKSSTRCCGPQKPTSPMPSRAHWTACCRNLGHSLTSALANLSDRFADTLSSSANQEFEQVVKTLGGTARLLEGMNAQFQASQTMLTELVHVARNTTAEQMALGKTQVEELTAVLRELMTQMHHATDTSVHQITATLTAVVHDLSTQVTELGQQMSQTVTASTGHATGAAQAVIERADQWSARSAEQLAQLLDKHHSQLDRVQDVQRTLDTTLVQFKGSLGEFATVTGNLSQITTQTSAMVAAAGSSTRAIQDAGVAIGHVAQLTAVQVDGFKTVVGSMQHYEDVFRRVEETAGKLLVQIERHLRNYQETTQEGFDKLTSTANGFITDATQKLGATVNELDEYLQDLTEIFRQLPAIGEQRVAADSESTGLGSSLTDLMTSLAVIFILLLVASHNNEQHKLEAHQGTLADTTAKLESTQRELDDAKKRTNTTRTQILVALQNALKSFSAEGVRAEADPRDPLGLLVIVPEDLLKFTVNGDKSHQGV